MRNNRISPGNSPCNRGHQHLVQSVEVPASMPGCPSRYGSLGSALRCRSRSSSAHELKIVAARVCSVCIRSSNCSDRRNTNPFVKIWATMNARNRQLYLNTHEKHNCFSHSPEWRWFDSRCFHAPRRSRAGWSGATVTNATFSCALRSLSFACASSSQATCASSAFVTSHL